MLPGFSLYSAHDADEIVETLLHVYRRRGHEAYHGEPVSQLEHAVQTAELARRVRPEDPEFILAAFLHDIGHLCAPETETTSMGGYGIIQHETVGAQYLQACHFSQKVTRLVAGHVAAKRYLVATNPAYQAALSEASRITLEKQGGPMTPAEIAQFENDPLFALHLQLRRLDEQAKETGRPAPDLFWLEILLRKHLMQQL